MRKLKVGVVGVGYLGQFHAEKYAALSEVELTGVVDTDSVRGGHVAQKLNTRWFPQPSALLGKVDAVSIVVPTALHYEVARPFLEQGVHTLLEKPITVTLQQADDLIALAREKNAVLQIGHIERFNPAFTSIKAALKAPRFLTAERAAPFTVRCTDVNVVLDLMIHDLDIVADLAGSEPKEVSAAGASVITSEIDIATARILFENGCVADVTASRVSGEKKRVLRVFDGDRIYTGDYQSQKASVSNRGGGDIPELTSTEIPTERQDTLNLEIRHFIGTIQAGGSALVSGREGRRALALAQVITTAIENRIPGFVPAA